MKKTLVIVLTLVMALSVVALASCSGTTYEGSYSYKSAYWSEQSPDIYGCKVKVTVQGDVITSVVVENDTEHFHNLSPNWAEGYVDYGKDAVGKTNWIQHGQEMADSFVGLTVDEVLRIKVYVHATSFKEGYENIPAGQPITDNGNKYMPLNNVPAQLLVVAAGYGDYTAGTGATQSTGRLILAVQDALLGANGDITKNPGCVQIDMSPKGE